MSPAVEKLPPQLLPRRARVPQLGTRPPTLSGSVRRNWYPTARLGTAGSSVRYSVRRMPAGAKMWAAA
jgi:hypothetical protein